MMDNTITVIEAHIQQKRTELERLQRAVAAIPQVQSDLAALERTLAILRGDTASKPLSSGQSYSIPQEPYPELAQAIIREEGRPLTGDGITAIARSKGKTVKRASLMGALYRCLKEGKYFTLAAPGTFGLLEWENDSRASEQSLLGESQNVSATAEAPRESEAPLGNANGAFYEASVTER